MSEFFHTPVGARAQDSATGINCVCVPAMSAITVSTADSSNADDEVTAACSTAATTMTTTTTADTLKATPARTNEIHTVGGWNGKDRTILCADSIEWLRNIADGGLPRDYGVFTSMPDISEMQPTFGSSSNYKVEEYKEWFRSIAVLLMQKMAYGSYVIFLQSDVRVVNPSTNDMICWIDKSFLCSSAAQDAGCTLMWHKLVSLNSDLGKRSAGRPTFSHFLCYRKNIPVEQQSSTAAVASFSTSHFAVPDIFYRGHMLWSKGIGLDCCYVGVKFLKDIALAKCIFDPFVGKGTVASMANALGLDALGIELSNRRCKFALRLNTVYKLDLVSTSLRKISLEVVADRAAHVARRGVKKDSNNQKTRSRSRSSGYGSDNEVRCEQQHGNTQDKSPPVDNDTFVPLLSTMRTTTACVKGVGDAPPTTAVAVDDTI